MNKIRSDVDNYFLKDFMLKQIKDFTRLYEEIENSHDLAIREALKYKLDEIQKFNDTLSEKGDVQ